MLLLLKLLLLESGRRFCQAGGFATRWSHSIISWMRESFGLFLWFPVSYVLKASFGRFQSLWTALILLLCLLLPDRWSKIYNYSQNWTVYAVLLHVWYTAFAATWKSIRIKCPLFFMIPSQFRAIDRRIGLFPLRFGRNNPYKISLTWKQNGVHWWKSFAVVISYECWT